MSVQLALRSRRVDAELNPGGSDKDLVGKGLDAVRARLATIRPRLVILNKICEISKLFSNSEVGVNFKKEFPLNEISENLKVLLIKMRGGQFYASNLFKRKSMKTSDLVKIFDYIYK